MRNDRAYIEFESSVESHRRSMKGLARVVENGPVTEPQPGVIATEAKRHIETAKLWANPERLAEAMHNMSQAALLGAGLIEPETQNPGAQLTTLGLNYKAN